MLRHNSFRVVATTLITLVITTGCVSDSPASSSSINGLWRATLESPGGELPFGLEITGATGSTELEGFIHNGDERVPLSGIDLIGDDVVMAFAWYDSEIRARLRPGGDVMNGHWRKTAPGGDSTLPFAATRGTAGHRFTPSRATGGNQISIAGTWSVVFEDDDGREPAIAELTEKGGGEISGTFLTPTGDYRFLAGDFDGRRLRLSTFDGAHAFLFDARASADGSLQGDFWSRDTYHARWTARLDPKATLPDPWSAVTLHDMAEGRLRFSFPDLDGQLVTDVDPRFAGKAVVVNIFGSWCPNCNDEAPLLAGWSRRYRDQGLEIVGLAYEFSGEQERDREMVRRFAARHDIDYTLLLAGVSDKEAAAETLPDLSAVLSYPTTIFIGRDGLVRKIHSGFTGPGTGGHFPHLVAELEAAVEEILTEPNA